jgi:hypothetical protein
LSAEQHDSDREEAFRSRFRPRAAVSVLAAYLVAFGALGSIQYAAAGIIDPDGYYHIRWARLLWEHLPSGELPRFVWLPLTILDEEAYVDHHFLFHVFQIPFTWGSDLVAGAKLSAVIFGALPILSCYLLIAASGVCYRWIWLVGLCASGPFLFRMSLPRAPAVTIVTLVVAVFLLFARRYVWLGVLSFALVWMYSLFPLVGVLAVAWAVGVYLEEQRLEWRAVVWPACGIVAGLLINPYFPENIWLFVDHFKMKIGAEYEVDVGMEWYPYESWYLVASSAVAWAAQLAGWLAMRPEKRENRARIVTLFLFSTFLLVVTMKSRRFIEYWPPMALVFAAWSLAPWLRDFRPAAYGELWQRLLARGAVCAVAAVVLIAAGQAVWITRESVKGIWDEPRYAPAARWLAANSPPGSMVFNTDWDDFPMLFHYNTSNVYASGLDPTYLLHADPELSKLYEDITLGRIPDPGPLIRDRFGARYAFTDSGHTTFVRQATEGGGMRIVWEDEYALVLEVVD